jgi:hypothetical protein
MSCREHKQTYRTSLRCRDGSGWRGLYILEALARHLRRELLERNPIVMRRRHEPYIFITSTYFPLPTTPSVRRPRTIHIPNRLFRQRKHGHFPRWTTQWIPHAYLMPRRRSVFR